MLSVSQDLPVLYDDIPPVYRRRSINHNHNRSRNSTTASPHVVPPFTPSAAPFGGNTTNTTSIAPQVVPTPAPTLQYTTTTGLLTTENQPTKAPTTKLIKDCPKVVIERSQFNNNQAGTYGGSIYSEHYITSGCMSMIFANSDFSNNYAGIGGGAFGCRRFSIDDIHSTVYVDDNSYTVNDSTTIQIDNCLFKDNSARKYGGSMAVKGSSNCDSVKSHVLELTNTSIIGSKTSHSGGGIYSTCATVKMYNGTMNRNSIAYDKSESSTTSCETDTSDCYSTIATRIKGVLFDD